MADILPFPLRERESRDGVVHLPLVRMSRWPEAPADYPIGARFVGKQRMVTIPPRFERLCDWLGDTFGESPRGFAFLCGLLFPICAAAFCAGYFGLSELLRAVLP